MSDQPATPASNPAFERNLSKLLQNAYEQPEIRPAFRQDLFEKLKTRQQQKQQVQRRRVISLYSTLAAAAAAAIVIGMQFYSPTLPTAQTPPTVAAVPTVEAVAGSQNHTAVPAVADVSHTIGARTTMVSANQLQPLNNPTVRALQPIDLRKAGQENWTQVKKDMTFTFANGDEIRSPIGSPDPVMAAFDNGPSIMLDGLSRVCVENGKLRLIDGRAVISLKNANNPLGVELGEQALALEPGSMAFLQVTEGKDFAAGGAPAPVVTILNGSGYTLGAHRTTLVAGMVYDLYETSTGMLPSRTLGRDEYKRHNSQLHIMQAANQIDK